MAGPWEQYAAPAETAEAGPWTQYQSAPDTSLDALKSLGIGGAKGVIGIAGLPGDAAELLAMGVDKATSGLGRLFGQDWSRATNIPGAASKPLGESAVGSQAIQRGIEGVTGEFYKPQTTTGEYARTIGEFLPGAAMGPGGIARRLASQAVVPGVASEYAGQQTKGTAAEPYARFGAAVAGSLVPGMAARALNPAQTVSAERRAAGDALRAEGITPTAGQETGSNFLKAMESPFGHNPEPQLEALTAAAMRRTGEAGGRAGADDLNRALTRIGNEFDTLAARNTLGVDAQLANDFGTVQRDYNFLANPMQRQVVGDAINDIVGVIQQNNGVIPGAQYQAMRSRLGTAARSAQGSDNQLSQAMYGLQHALDDAMERSIAATNPADLNGWQQARNQYRNFLVVERAATGAGSDAALGLITAPQLSSATKSVQGRRNYGQGEGDFADLARAADALLRPLPNSGTPVRAAAAALPSALGAGIGSILGIKSGAGATMGGAAGALAAPILTNAAVNNPIAQAYLSGRILGQGLLAQPTTTIPRDAFMQGLLRSQGLLALP